MNDLGLYYRFALVSAVVAGGLVAGVGLLLFAPRGWPGRAAVAAAAVAAASGLTAVLVPGALGWVAGGGAAVAAVAVMASLPAVRRLIGRCGRPRVLGGAALLAAFGVWGYEAWRFDVATEHELNDTLARVEIPAATRPVAYAATDRGGAVPLNATADPHSAVELAVSEGQAAALAGRSVIRRGAASDASNCHGWVFTGGRFHVSSTAVDAILADNGYTQVSEPAAGDLCVYRGPTGEPTHTSIVRACLSDGTVLVEGKWGRLGVYLHETDESCYGTTFTFHRTARGSHLLRGLDDTTAPVQASEHP